MKKLFVLLAVLATIYSCEKEVEPVSDETYSNAYFRGNARKITTKFYEPRVVNGKVVKGSFNGEEITSYDEYNRETSKATYLYDGLLYSYSRYIYPELKKYKYVRYVHEKLDVAYDGELGWNCHIKTRNSYEDNKLAYITTYEYYNSSGAPCSEETKIASRNLTLATYYRVDDNGDVILETYLENDIVVAKITYLYGEIYDEKGNWKTAAVFHSGVPISYRERTIEYR